MVEKVVHGDGAEGIGVNVVNVFVSVHQPVQAAEAREELVKSSAKEVVARVRETLHCGLESTFGTLGAAVGRRPWMTILICCLFAGVACTVSAVKAWCSVFNGWDVD